MSQRSVVESQTQSNLTPALRSALKTALGTLDVQLDEELARYRRSRSGVQLPSARIGQHHQRKSLDLISVGATADKKPSGDGATTAQPAPSSVPTEQPQTQEEPKWYDQTALPGSLSSQFALATTVPDRASASLAPASVEEASLLDTATNHTGPDDYLESSEALLRSLGEEQLQKRTEPNFSESLLTPLGVGSMLLLLLASATLGYVVMNPTTLTALKDRLFGQPLPSTATNSSGPTNTNSASGGVLPLPDSPNLASREFVDLDLNTLSSIKPRASNSPSVVPTLVPTAKATVLPNMQPNMQTTATGGSTTTLAPLPQAPRVQSLGVGLNAAPTQTALPVRRHHQKTATQQSESAVPPAAKYSLSPSTQQQRQSLTLNNYYYVVTDYRGERNLEKARGLVADAYVDTSSQGSLIHLGALKSELEAQKLAEELQRKGIQARIYRP